MEPNDLIGNTPIVKWGTHHNATIWIKEEGRNLTGSLKDRTAKQIVTAVLSDETLTAKELLDTSSGSYACALAMQARLHNLPVTLVVNEKISKTNLAYITKIGATVIQHGKVTGDGFEYCKKLTQKYPEKYFFTDQLNNPLAVEAHYKNTAPEIFNEFSEPSAIVVSIGSGATARGIAQYIEEHNKKTALIGSVGIEGDIKKVAGTYRADGDYITPFIKELFERNLIEKVPIAYQAAMDAVWTHLIPRGIQVGPQGGGVLLAAMKAIENHSLSGDVIVVAGDSILKNMDRYND